LTWLSSDVYEKSLAKLKELKNFDGIIVPGGFGSRGVEGKIKTIEYCRKHNIPYLGLCYGMQLAVVEFARNICHMKDAHTTEIVKHSQYPVIDTLPEQQALLREKKYGASMRLGEYPCLVKKGSLSHAAYNKAGWGKTNKKGDILIQERHRHRYEFNNEFRQELENKGLVISGLNPERDLVEIIELTGHPFFVGCQFHPEFKSKPLNPHPLFREFIRAAIRR